MYCPRCERHKHEAEFSWRNKKKGLRQRYCKKCMAALNSSHYQRNKDSYLARNKAAIAANREFIWHYLLAHPCVDCGEDDPLVLEFDHVDRSAKHKGVSRLMRDSCSLATLQKEIDKCVVRCANCHRRRTAHQLGWWVDRT